MNSAMGFLIFTKKVGAPGGTASAPVASARVTLIRHFYQDLDHLALKEYILTRSCISAGGPGTDGE